MSVAHKTNSDTGYPASDAMETAAGGAAFVAMTAAPSAVCCVLLMDNPILE